MILDCSAIVAVVLREPVAKLAGEPLLSTGHDFPKTDLPLA